MDSPVVPRAPIPRWALPIDEDLRRRARRQLARVEERVERFSGQIVLGLGSIDNRIGDPDLRDLRHRLIAVLNREGFTDTQIGRLLGMDRRSVAYILGRPAPRRTA